MGTDAGPVLFALALGVPLSAGVAWIVSGLYRRRMLALMRGGPAPDDAHPTSRIVTTDVERPAPTLDSGANRSAMMRQLIVIAGLSLLIGLTQSWLALWFVYPADRFSVNRLLVLGLVYAWPMVMAWGLLRRWSWLRICGGIALYMLTMVVIVMLASNRDQTMTAVAAWLFGVVAIPIAVSLLISASGRIRAVAPYLLPVFVLLAGSSVFVLGLLAQAVEYRPDWLIAAVEALGAWATLLLVALAPWVALAWPIYAFARRLALAYRNKRFSDAGYLFAAYWLVILAASALPALQGVGLVGLTQLLPWLWIPITTKLLRGWLAPRGAPPTLLVLRVFQQDRQVGLLFDRVVERWRLSGNSVLIAGTDLLSRTLDPDDLFTFLDGRLASRFIANEAQLAQRIAELDRSADPDGRYRVNECYCFDSTWQAALAALVRESDVVLMDLRGFRETNLGCRHELGVLADAAHLCRVVLLSDDTTARSVAEADLAGASPGRFVWVEAGRMNSAKSDEVLASLFGEYRAAAG